MNIFSTQQHEPTWTPLLAKECLTKTTGIDHWVGSETAADMIESKILDVDQKIAALKQLKQLLERLSRHIGKCGDKGEMEFLSELMIPD